MPDQPTDAGKDEATAIALYMAIDYCKPDADNFMPIAQALAIARAEGEEAGWLAGFEAGYLKAREPREEPSR
jgi:hypothetical protein